MPAADSVAAGVWCHPLPESILWSLCWSLVLAWGMIDVVSGIGGRVSYVYQMKESSHTALTLQGVRMGIVIGHCGFNMAVSSDNITFLPS